MTIRKQTYSLDMYLKLMNAETIRTDQDCQRLSGQWKPNMVGELIATVLTDNYIPPIILGHLSMIFDAKWQNFCVRKIPMPMLV